MRTCIHGCGNSIKPGSKLNECVTCRQSLYYWRKKRPAQIIARRHKLDVYGSRLDEHFDTHGKEDSKQPVKAKRRGNVVQFRTRRTA